MNTTRAIRCQNSKCVSEWQDKKYGQGMRVCNLKQKDQKLGQFVCTVCETINHQALKDSEVADVKEKKARKAE